MNTLGSIEWQFQRKSDSLTRYLLQAILAGLKLNTGLEFTTNVLKLLSLTILTLTKTILIR